MRVGLWAGAVGVRAAEPSLLAVLERALPPPSPEVIRAMHANDSLYFAAWADTDSLYFVSAQTAGG